MRELNDFWKKCKKLKLEDMQIITKNLRKIYQKIKDT